MSMNFQERIRDFFYYPKLTRENDTVRDGREFGQYLNRESDTSEPFSMYIHIPFCDYLCHFCPFFKVLNQQTPDDMKQRFVQALVDELKLYARSEYFSGRRLEWVEFGGGTPTSIDTAQLELILTTIHEEFQIEPGSVITMEGDALTLSDRTKVTALNELGVNRVSYGVQTFDERLRKRLGLKPTVADVRRAAETVRSCGIGEFATDIMYNLPDQPLETLENDLDLMFDLGPDYIDLYSLTLWENTVFKEKVEKGKSFTLAPSNARNIATFDRIQQIMTERGMVPARSYTYVTDRPHEFISVSKNRIRNRGESIGIGPSSRGYAGRRHSINTASIEDYVADIEAGKLSIDLGAEVDSVEEAHRLMVLFPAMLMEIGKSDVPYYEEIFAPRVRPLVEGGYLWESDDRIGLTASGQLWSGNVSRQFFSERQRSRMTESFLFSKRVKINPYNQDRIGLRKGKR